MNSRYLSALKFTTGNYAWVWFPILSLVVLTWSPDGTLVMAGSFAWPTDFAAFLEKTLYLWDSSVNLGYVASRQLASAYPYAVLGTLLAKTGLSQHWVQFAFFYVSFLFSGIGPYLLARQWNWPPRAALLAGIIYMFSPYAAIAVWNPVYGFSFPFYAFLPFNLFLFMRFIAPETPVWSKAGFGLASGLSLLSMSFANPAYLIAYFGLLLLFFLSAFATSIRRISVTAGAIAFIALLFLLNADFIVPFATDFQDQFQIANSTVSWQANDIRTANLNSVAIQDAFRMIGFWTIQGGEQYDYYFAFHETLLGVPYTIISYALPLMAVLALVDLHKKFRMEILFLGILLVFALQINAGFKIGGIFGWINTVLLSNEMVLRAFRAIYLKLGTLLALPIALLAGHWLDGFMSSNATNKTKGWLVGVSSFLFVGYVAAPFYDGALIKPEGKYLAGYNVSIPEEYIGLGKKDRKRPLDSRYLSLPLPHTYSYALSWKNGGYRGGDFVRLMLTKPLFVVNFGTELERQLVEAINRGDPDLLAMLGLFNFRNIISHKDIKDRQANHYRTKYEIDDPRLKSWIDNRYFKVDAIPERYFMPKWYTVEKVWRMAGDALDLRTVIQLSGDGRRFAIVNEPTPPVTTISDDGQDMAPVIEFRRLSPVAYRVRIHNARGTVPIVFNEACHNGWRLYSAPEASRPVGDGRPASNSEALLDKASPGSLRAYANAGWVSAQPTGAAEPRFVSRMIKGTIQNDNLPGIDMRRLLTHSPLPERAAKHTCANIEVNAWFVNVDATCQTDSGACRKEPGGGVSLDLVAAFAPQTLVYQGRTIVLATFAGLGVLFLFGGALAWIKNRLSSSNTMS